MPDLNQVQGLPPGVVLDSVPHDAAPQSSATTDNQGISGLPPGVVLDSAPHDSVPTAPSAASQTTPPAAPPQPQGFYQASGVKSLVDQAKATWATGQQQRDREAQVVKDVTDSVKRGDFGTAAETLLSHLYHGAINTTKQQFEQGGAALTSMVGEATHNVKANLTELDPNHGQMYASPVFPGPGVGSAAGDFASEGSLASAGEKDLTAQSASMAPKTEAQATTATPKQSAVANATSKSGITAGVPETVAPSGESIQPTLHQGIRDFVNKTNAAAGLPPVADDVNILDAAQNQADAFQVRSQATFDKVEKITGVNPTTLKQIMKTRADQIETFQAAGNDEEAGNLQQLQLNDENRVQKAFDAAQTKGVSVDQARSDWNKSLRADELSTAIRGSKSNISTLASPDIDPSKLTSRLQKFYESQPGGKTAKLAQLGGDQNAANLVEHAETARDAARTIKEFVPQSATGQQALSKIVSDNTIEKSSLIRGGKAVGRTDWNGVVKDIGNLTPEQQKAFGNELAQVRQYAGKQALRQNAISLLKKGAYTVGGLGVGGEIIKHVLP